MGLFSRKPKQNVKKAPANKNTPKNKTSVKPKAQSLKEKFSRRKNDNSMPIEKPFVEFHENNFYPSDLAQPKIRMLKEHELPPPRVPYSDRYRPMYTFHGPGLSRNHQFIRGDNIKETGYFNRTYIYHRAAFDWYDTRRENVLDDIEEILEPNSKYYEVISNDNYFKYNRYHCEPNGGCGKMPRKLITRTDDDKIYIVKRKDHPIYSNPEIENNQHNIINNVSA